MKHRARLRVPLALALALAAAVVGASRAGAAADAVADAVVDAGIAALHLEADPFRMRLLDGDGVPVLVGSSARDPESAGALGFRSEGTWRHATSAQGFASDADGTVSALLATDDPRGRRIRLVASRDGGDGVVRIAATVEDPPVPDDPLAGITAPPPALEAVGVGWESDGRERFFGFGERASGVDHAGRTVESHVSDGPWQPDEYPLMRGILPKPGFRPRDDATYFPIPWLLSDRGYGVLVDGDDTVVHRLDAAATGRWSVEVRGAPDDLDFRAAPPTLVLRLFAGPRPADALARFSQRVGRQPPADAPWVFGPWFQPGGSVADQVGQIRALREAGAPVSVAQTYLHYLPCGGNRANEPERNRAMHDLGVAVTTYVNPMVCRSYEEAYSAAEAVGGLVRDESGAPYVYEYFTTRFFEVSQYDFTAPSGRAAFADVLRLAIEDGHDGWMEDFGEYTPLDARVAAPLAGAALHNRYVVDYHCAAWDFARRQSRPVIRFQRSGWTGAARCAQVVWGGDPTTGWGFDGLASVVHAGLGLGLSGVSTWGSDIGGFFSFYGRTLDGELLRRWVQLGAFSGVMRTERDGIAIPEIDRPQVNDADQLPNWRRYARLRTQLYPYIAAAAETYTRTGLPIMRHLVLGWPDDAESVARDDEYLFGPDILVAPVLEPGATERSAYLPPGEWIDLWRSVRFDGARGALEARRPVLVRGGRHATVPAPAEEIPLFLRAGALLPLLPASVNTLADHGAGMPGVVRLGDGPRRRHLLAFPRGHSRAAVDRRGRLESSEEPGGWRLRIDGPRTRWRVQASLAALLRPIRPCAVEWNGVPLPAPAWRWSAADAVLRARFEGGRGELFVRACG